MGRKETQLLRKKVELILMKQPNDAYNITKEIHGRFKMDEYSKVRYVLSQLLREGCVKASKKSAERNEKVEYTWLK